MFLRNYKHDIISDFLSYFRRKHKYSRYETTLGVYEVRMNTSTTHFLPRKYHRSRYYVTIYGEIEWNMTMVWNYT